MIEQLYNYLISNEEKIFSWYKSKVKSLEESSIPLPIYSSFDIRDSGYKASIVDSNIYPAGFNNLDLGSRQFASTKFLEYLSSISQSKDILIIPENHTRNVYYFEHIKVLLKILKTAGFNTNIGYIEEGNNPVPFTGLENAGNDINPEKIFRNNGKACTESFNDGIIILNNDLSVSCPKILEDISQPVLPSIFLGWYQRKKSSHFQYFNNLITELAILTSFDPWFLGAYYTSVDNINFKEKESLNIVADAVDMVIERISLKYEEYDIRDDPLVFVKNNSGTYGLGIISVSSGEDVKNLNSKNRKKMIFGKGRSRIDSVLIQEGIYTKYVENCNPAEPVIYNVGGEPVGGFMRVNTLQTAKKNLNTRGMSFKKIVENKQTQPIVHKNGKFSLYSLLTRIADLAIAYEHKQNLVN